ncbi:uncharacterized protein E0L32_011157 [Thyridium curvatum]|uniref:Altered inheritance of mitochondria protein 6 n=1 Tax=Thyridium curvatum TaxID=1093900 RepID=A0A507AIF4_9PEZI|nr:uncharacterized protein E0L32_011157 [Thyridium curvatum]TPX06933.1 hypothetical protein E0L32_011157 [Thyridium curvatum]
MGFSNTVKSFDSDSDKKMEDSKIDIKQVDQSEDAASFSQPSSPSSEVASPLERKSSSDKQSTPTTHGLSAVRHIASTYRIRALRGRRPDYEQVASGSEDDNDDDDSSDTYLVDEETLISHSRPKRRRRWLICGSVLGLTLLAVLLVLNILIFISRSAYGDAEEDPDVIFASWGRGGTGTEGLAWYPTDFLRDVLPKPIHSHNDYWRKVPLFSALHVGCTGVEADVFEFENDPNLYVGHVKSALQPNRTFESLYINPLVEILTRTNSGSKFANRTHNGVFDMDPDQTLALLVDVKTDGASTIRRVMEQLEPLRSRGWLTYFENGTVHYGPVTVVGTGNTPFDVLVANATYRDVFFDAPLDKLQDSAYDHTNSFYSSVSFGSSIGRVWFGGMAQSQLGKVRTQLMEAANRGLKPRYWDLPAWPVSIRNRIWDTLVQEGIAMLNVDDIKAAAKLNWAKI